MSDHMLEIDWDSAKVSARAAPRARRERAAGPRAWPPTLAPAPLA
jgi:hypothetical protein